MSPACYQAVRAVVFPRLSSFPRLGPPALATPMHWMSGPLSFGVAIEKKRDS
jgi:hypothetical protein